MKVVITIQTKYIVQYDNKKGKESALRHLTEEGRLRIAGGAFFLEQTETGGVVIDIEPTL